MVGKREGEGVGSGRGAKSQRLSAAEQQAITSQSGQEVMHLDAGASLKFKKKTVKDLAVEAGNKRPWKSLKQIISTESFEKLPGDVPTYVSIDAPPSLMPPKKYCDLSGYEAKYTDPITKLRYCSHEQFALLRGLSDHQVQEYLALRNGHVKLR